MERKQKRKSKEYLDDFRKDLNGNYQYTGSYRRYNGKIARSKMLALLWLLCGGALAALIAAGCVPAPGAMDRFYVLLPYMAALVAAVSVVWALARLTAGGDPLRSYLYEQTVKALPTRCVLVVAFAGISAVGECVDLYLHGAQGAQIPSLLYLLLLIASGAANYAAFALVRRMDYTEESGEKT